MSSLLNINGKLKRIVNKDRTGKDGTVYSEKLLHIVGEGCEYYVKIPTKYILDTIVEEGHQYIFPINIYLEHGISKEGKNVGKSYGFNNFVLDSSRTIILL